MTTTNLAAGPLWPVDGPLPLAPVYGLLQAAKSPSVRIVTDADGEGRERWINGIKVRPYPGDSALTFDASSLCGTSPDEKEEGDDVPLPEFSSFTAYLPIVCTTRVVGDELEAFRQRAAIALDAVQGSAVEKVLLGGQGLINPFLADGEGEFPNTNTLTSPIEGLALLENEIALSGKAGLIHVSPALATFLRAAQVIEDDGRGVLRTVNGTVVIPGTGYVPNVSPAGKTAASGTQEWAYATGPVDVRRSDLFINPETPGQAVDRSINKVVYRAERYYNVAWDTLVQAAVRVDRCQTTC